MKNSSMSRIKAVAVTLFAGLTIATLSPLAANAATSVDSQSVLSEKAEKQVRDFFEEFDVSVATQDDLISTYERGGSWDSFSSDSVPQSTESMTAGGETWTVERFADGSVRAQGIGDDRSAGGGISTMGVNDCAYTEGAFGNFSNCSIYYWVGVVSFKFYANFTVADGNNSITSAWGGELFAGGACSQSVPEARVIKERADEFGPANAGTTAQATMCVTNAVVNFPSYLRVQNNAATHFFE